MSNRHLSAFCLILSGVTYCFSAASRGQEDRIINSFRLDAPLGDLVYGLCEAGKVRCIAIGSSADPLEAEQPSGSKGRILRDVPIKTVLNELVAAHPSYSWRIDAGWILVFPREKTFPDLQSVRTSTYTFTSTPAADAISEVFNSAGYSRAGGVGSFIPAEQPGFPVSMRLGNASVLSATRKILAPCPWAYVGIQSLQEGKGSYEIRCPLGYSPPPGSSGGGNRTVIKAK